MMQKEKYEHTELDIIEFETKDIIMSSGETDEYEYNIPN